MTKLFIGMPVYNGERFIAVALESLCRQNYKDWKLLISDNCSSDATESICKGFARKDSRISYVRQPENLGGTANFKFLLEQADSEYFMWASADDVWDPDFLNICIGNLEKNGHFGMSFSGIINIDSYGRVVRECPTLPSLSGNAGYKTIYRYLKDPEIMGKANLIYSVYRLEICREAMAVCPLEDFWGSDMCFVLAALTRGGILIDQRVLFKKRLVREDDDEQALVKPINVAKPRRGIFPREEFPSYLRGNLNAVRGTQFFFLTYVVMMLRKFVASMRVW